MGWGALPGEFQEVVVETVTVTLAGSPTANGHQTRQGAQASWGPRSHSAQHPEVVPGMDGVPCEPCIRVCSCVLGGPALPAR